MAKNDDIKIKFHEQSNLNKLWITEFWTNCVYIYGKTYFMSKLTSLLYRDTGKV